MDTISLGCGASGDTGFGSGGYDQGGDTGSGGTGGSGGAVVNGVPEPDSLFLVGLGLAGFAGRRCLAVIGRRSPAPTGRCLGQLSG